MARRTLASLALAAAFLAGAQAPAQACGAPDEVCRVAQGEYRLALPDETDSEGGKVPALIFLHGWGGSARGTMRNRAMIATLNARGFALIVPEGIARTGQKQRNWGVADGAPFPRDDIAFLREVVEDAARRGVDRDRILLSGFSRGGSMVWNVACFAPGMVRAYAPVAGAFWLPMPEGCQGPVDLFHTHGWADRVVPLEGRAVAGGARVQGDAFASLAILRRALGCRAQMPDRTEALPGPILMRHWERCKAGRIDLMLHSGSHGVPKGWVTRALDWFEERLAEDKG